MDFYTDAIINGPFHMRNASDKSIWHRKVSKFVSTGRKSRPNPPHMKTHINCAALILFAYAVAVLEGVCGLKEPYVGTLISVNMMTKMLRWTKTSGLSCCSASQMCQEGGLELSAHGIRQLPLIKGIHNLSWKTSRCIHNCTSGSWKWKHEDESRAGQKDITTLLEFPQSWQLAYVYWTFIARKQYYFLFIAVVRKEEKRQATKWKTNCAGSERYFYFNT